MLRSFSGSAGAALFKPVHRDVAAGRFQARSCGNQRELACAATHVQQPGSRLDSKAVVKLFGVLFHVAGKEIVIAGHPGGFQARFKLAKIGRSQYFFCNASSLLPGNVPSRG